MPLPNGRQQLEQFSITTLQTSGCVTGAEKKDTLENIATQTFIVNSTSHTHTTHQYAGHTQTSYRHTPWLLAEGHPQHNQADNKTGYKNQQKKHLWATLWNTKSRRKHR